MSEIARAEASIDVAGDALARSVGARLAAIYTEIAERSMRDLPVYDPRLSVEAVGFTAVGDRVVGVLTTPWFMNLVVCDRPGGAPATPAVKGASVTHVLPGGEFSFVVGEIDGFGRLDSASLFSPMFDFADAATVRATAEAAIAEVMTAPTEEPTATPPAERRDIDRRALLFGRRESGEAATCR
ncbi:MAG: [NiFe]-hydrogenase assembly chaperone HybE [Hyphomicrobiales bacterium]|nr:[NiFe]-hydrogenase assembly chaperone HybE [Hyphomicrobiales bacterium]